MSQPLLVSFYFEKATSSSALHTLFRMANQNKVIVEQRQCMQIDVNCCKCEFPAEGLVLKIERDAQRLTQGYNALGGS